MAHYQPRTFASSKVFVLKLYDFSIWFEYIKVDQICSLKNGWSNKVDLLPDQGRTQEFCLGGGGSTNSVEDRGQGSGGGNPLVRVLEAAVISYKTFHFIQ